MIDSLFTLCIFYFVYDVFFLINMLIKIVNPIICDIAVDKPAPAIPISRININTKNVNKFARTE